MSDAGRITRAQLLRAAGAGAVGAGALALPGSAVARPARKGTNPLTPGDREAVKFLISLEDVQLAVYRHAATISLSVPVARFAAQALARETAHRAALAVIERTRDVVPNRPNLYVFNANDDATFLALASRVEEAAVSGYNGVIVLLEQPAGLANVLAAIAADEAMHAGAVRVLAGLDPVTHSFDDPIKRADILPVIASPEG